MNHWKASRLLAALPDATLPVETECAVRAHVDRCARCEQQLSELELAETLLRRLPATILPLESSPTTYPRLSRLAAWSEAPDLPSPGRWRGPALGMAGALAALLLVVAVGGWQPVFERPNTSVKLAYVPEDSVSLPVTWRPGN